MYVLLVGHHGIQFVNRFKLVMLVGYVLSDLKFLLTNDSQLDGRISKFENSVVPRLFQGSGP